MNATLFIKTKLKRSLVALASMMMLLPTVSTAQIDYQIGNGTNPGSCYSYPSPFADYFKSNRQQYLFLASELTAAGMSAGVITAIKWNVTTACTNPVAALQGYTIKMGATNATTAATWINGISTPVYGPSTYTHSNGINAFTLPTPFVWNGTDNIAIEICHNNTSNSNYTYNATVNYTTTSFVSTYYGISDITNWCGNTASYTSTYDRPNTIFTYGQPCTGVPTTEVAGPNEVCPNKPFNLTFTQFWSGISVTWQTSTNGVNWANWTGPVTISGITDAITQEKWYRAIVKCNATNHTYTTQPKLVKIAPFYYCYCDASKATSTAAGLDVGNVTVQSFPANTDLVNNGSASPFLGNATANKGYTDFRYSVPPIPMYHDSIYRVKVSQVNQPTSFAKAMGAVYIDFNRNGTFDVAERVLLDSTKQLPPFYGTITDTFKVPETAGYGLTGMRVILVAGAGNPDTCAPYNNGETEDYLVDLRYLPCSSAHAGTIVGDSSMCVNYDYVLLDSTYQKERHGLSHFWQLSADNVNWVNVTGSTDKDTLMRLFTGQPFYYRVTQVCSHVNDTDRVVHKVNLKPAYKCYCHSQSLGGDKDTSDVGGFAIYNFEITDGGAHLANPRAVRKRQDYTDLQPIEMWVDSMYQFRVFHTMPNSFHSDGKITVFMDFDNDRQYDLPGERVFTGFTNVGLHTIIKNIIIPDSVIVDLPTGMRVIVNNDVAPNAPSDEGCGTYVSGETEDYMMIFRRAFPAGVQEVKGIEDVQLFPNPTSGKFTIHFRSGSAVREVKIKVLSMTGQLVTQEVTGHTGGRFMKEIDLGNYAKGVYLVELDADGIKSTNRVVVR